MLHGVVTIEQAIASGTSRRKVYRNVERGEWLKLHEGVFLTTPAIERDARWKADLAAGLLRGGKDSMVSHRSAAILRGLEGMTGRPIDLTISGSAKHRLSPAHRFRCVDPDPVTIDGLLTTSLVKTLLDLAQLCAADVVEQAVESAIRGPDPRQPDVWNEALLSQLRAAALEQPRRRGSFTFRTVLDRRSDADRPTGSFPETLLFQALRDLGIDTVRQPTLRIVDLNGYRLDTLFPDLGSVQRRLLLEVDGGAAHNELTRQRDLRRQNKVLRGFALRRYTAVEILDDAAAVAREIERSTRRERSGGSAESDDCWTVDGVSVSYSANEFLVVDSRRDAREEAKNRRAS
jgi:very-short-patch-repair endonuclease